MQPYLLQPLLFIMKNNGQSYPSCFSFVPAPVPSRYNKQFPLTLPLPLLSPEQKGLANSPQVDEEAR